MSSVREIEPEILQRLGLVVVKWSLVEAWVSDLFVGMTSGDKGAMIVVTSNVSQSTISDWIRTLLDILHTPPDLAEEIRDVLTEIHELRTQRNALIHGLWSTAGPANSVIVSTVKLDRREIIKELVVTPADLDDLISLIEEIAGRLKAILIAAGLYSPA